MPELQLGSKGIEVQQLQLLLNAQLNPSPNLRPDGDFGKKTLDALVRFQSLKGLSPSGSVGAETLKALGLRTAPVTVVVTAGGPDWMGIAQAELGVHENSLPGQHNKRIVEYHATTTFKATQDETPWCSSFVNWVLKQGGIKGTNSAAAKSWLKWGRALTEPQPGAITVIKKKIVSGTDAATGSSSGFHVGFFVSLSADRVRLLGGNQGDSVKYSEFSLAKYELKGYRWPE